MDASYLSAIFIDADKFFATGYWIAPASARQPPAPVSSSQRFPLPLQGRNKETQRKAQEWYTTDMVSSTGLPKNDGNMSVFVNICRL